MDLTESGSGGNNKDPDLPNHVVGERVVGWDGGRLSESRITAHGVCVEGAEVGICEVQCEPKKHN